MRKRTSSPEPSAGAVDVNGLARQVRAGDRRALAKAITLVESARADRQADAEALIAALLPDTGQAIRLGLSGAPGVGKSTFIEAFGLSLVAVGKKVAVLAVDPSSRRSGGSILGDKTRMERLAREDRAFIRPSPAGETLGGVARRTREAVLMVEAAGYDVVLVETVGVGQSETAVADMVDMFALLLAPGGGDELQGIKRGIMELADLVIINKADGDLLPAAKRAAADFAAALHLLQPKYNDWTPPVQLVSALKNEGMSEIWQQVTQFMDQLTAGGTLKQRRAHQARTWMWAEIREGLMAVLEADDTLMARARDLERAVTEGETSPLSAARQILAAFRQDRAGTESDAS